MEQGQDAVTALSVFVAAVFSGGFDGTFDGLRTGIGKKKLDNAGFFD